MRWILFFILLCYALYLISAGITALAIVKFSLIGVLLFLIVSPFKKRGRRRRFRP